MDMRFLLLAFAFIYFISLTLAAPRPPPLAPHSAIPGASENEIEENVVDGIKDDKEVDKGIDELDLEYGRYLQEVVKTLDEDPEFAKKLENITHDQIMSGHVAQQIASVAPDVRNKLDELKRIEMDRLRKLAMKEHQLEEQMERESHGNNNELYDEENRRWRTMGSKASSTNTKADPSKHTFDDKTAGHVDHANPHTFEAEDLQKLIMKATADLEELDRKRRRDFKQYEMEKEIVYKESLQNMTTDQRTEAEKKHKEIQEKHIKHDRINHPGSKHQLEQVWEEQDGMPKQEFDPKIFFQMHDVNGDGFLDQEEVESLLGLEVKKLYNEKDPSYDRNEMIEEYHRMREHIYKEIDVNHDGLISRKEFLDYTKSPEFEKDESWKGIEEAPVYTNEELKHYEQQRQQLAEHYAKYGAYQMPYHPTDGAGYGHPGYGQPVYYQVPHPNDPNYGHGQPHPNDPNYGHGMPHPNDPNYGQQHHGQQIQYVQVPAEHLQQQGQMHPGQQQQMHMGYQALPHPAQQHPGQQQQYMVNPNVPQLPPAQQQQQHPNQVPQIQQHPGQQQAMYNQQPVAPQVGHPQQQQQQVHMGYQAAPVQGQPQAGHPQQQQQQQHQAQYAVPPAQVHPGSVPNHPQAPPPQQQQQQQHPNAGQQHH